LAEPVDDFQAQIMFIM